MIFLRTVLYSLLGFLVGVVGGGIVLEILIPNAPRNFVLAYSGLVKLDKYSRDSRLIKN